ncbi:MAG: type IV pilus secretin PilQ [Vicinamibacterales bacterium]
MRWRFGLVVAATLSLATVAGKAAERTAEPVRLTDVRSDSASGRFALILEASAPVAYTTRQPDPLTLLVGLRNVAHGDVPPTTALGAAPVTRVDVGHEPAFDGVPTTLVRLALAGPAVPTVRSEGRTIRVEFPRDAVPAAAPVGAAVPVAPAPAGAGAEAASGSTATRLVAVAAATGDGRTTVSLRGNGMLIPRPVEEARDLPHRLVIDLPGVASSVPATTPVDSDSLARIRVSANSVSPLVTRVVLDLKRKVPYRMEQTDEGVVLILGESRASTLPAAPAVSALAFEPAVVALPVGDERELAMRPPAAALATAPVMAAPAPALPADLSSPVLTYAPSFAASSVDAAALVPPPAVPAVRAAPAVAPAPAMAVPAATQPAAAAQTTAAPVARPAVLAQETPDRQFTGHAVTLDFQGVDLRAVLRTFSEITGLNIVIDPSVQGTVDVNLRDVPWDQALDIILRANQLGYTVEGNIVRIAPLSKLREEQEEKRKLAEARALSGDLDMLSRTLSYAKAEDMIQLLTRAALTQRGSIQVDRRTNTLIIRDLPAGLDAARQLIDNLDRAQPQVEIEARIVQTNRNYLRELGFRWGIGAEASQRLGNATPLAFPNEVGIAGGTNNSTLNPAKNVIGLVTSSVNGAFNLDLELQAAERAGKVRILSTPRVSTQNNVEAEISQGTQIPVQTIANNTVTVTFKDATLTLKVRPQITSSNTVIMNVAVENGAPDYTRSVNGIPPIDTQRANTQVQVSDGATTVIGGIFVSSERNTEDRTPGLHRLPILGWLFKSDNRSDSSQELLIFLTPRIAKS